MSAPAGRRAPRLGPDESIAHHFTRTGRFRRINPRRGRPLPGVAKLVGAIGWAVLLEESLRRARKASRGGADVG
jgi:hypothetical protein